MKNISIVIILSFLALGEARRSTRLANVLSRQQNHSSECIENPFAKIGIVSVPRQFLVICRLTLGCLHDDAFRSIESHWFLGRASADNENDLHAIKEVKDGDTAKEMKDGEKNVDTKLETTTNRSRWRPFGSGNFAGVAQSDIDADKK
jgi:hypothetical protein